MHKVWSIKDRKITAFFPSCSIIFRKNSQESEQQLDKNRLVYNWRTEDKRRGTLGRSGNRVFKETENEVNRFDELRSIRLENQIDQRSHVLSTYRQLRQRVIHRRRCNKIYIIQKGRSWQRYPTKFSITEPACSPFSRNLCKAYSHRCLVTVHY